MVTLQSLLLSQLFVLSNAIHPFGSVYYQNDMETQNDADEWLWAGYRYNVPLYSSNCPGIGNNYCFGLLGSLTTPSPSPAGSITKTISTKGLWDIWISVDLNLIQTDTLDKCYMRLSANGGSFWNGATSIDYTNSEGTYITNLHSMFWDNTEFTVQFELDGEGTEDRCYIRNFILGAKPITPSPTNNPTHNPTQTPTTISPTNHPSQTPTNTPSAHPSITPTMTPTRIPTQTPTLFPTKNPVISSHPTTHPTLYPSNNPTVNPSNNPTLYPSYKPTKNPLGATTMSGHSGQVTNEIWVTESDTIIARGVDMNVMDMIIIIVCISIVAICGCIIFFYLWIKKQKQLQKAQKELISIKQTNSLSVTSVEEPGQNMDFMASDSVTPFGNVNKNNETITPPVGAHFENGNSSKQLMHMSEIQMEGITKTNGNIGFGKENINNDEDDDDMFGTFGATKG